MKKMVQVIAQYVFLDNIEEHQNKKKLLRKTNKSKMDL
jgi:hypothetical protein